MAAATSTTVFTVTPIAGVDVGAKSSSVTTPGIMKPLTPAFANNGREIISVRASEAIGSIETIKIGAAGSASSDSGSAGWTANVPGGATAGQFFWARRTAI